MQENKIIQIDALLSQGTKRLITLPIYPGTQSGYHKAVASDVNRLKPVKDDTVIIYWNDNKSSLDHAKLINRMPRYSIQRLARAIQLNVQSEVKPQQLEPLLEGNAYDSIFCGDAVFYRALRSIFPDQLITVRLHNLFSLANSRRRFLQTKTNLIYKWDLFTYWRLEREIAKDPKTQIIFINEKEEEFFHLHVTNKASTTWLIHPPKTSTNPMPPKKPKLVWFGSLVTHTRYSVEYFIDHVFQPLRKSNPNIEFHLWGGWTESMHNPDYGVYAHGFYEGNDMPLQGEALYVVPDLLGGGVKIKVGDLIHAEVPFIATPFAVEGNTVPESEHIHVADIVDWVEIILGYFKLHKLL